MNLPELVSRALSLLIAVGYVIAAGVSDGWQPDDAFFGIALMAPLALIWFPEWLGSYRGPLGHGHVTQDTPPCLVAAGGWFFLVGLPLILLWLEARP